MINKTIDANVFTAPNLRVRFVDGDTYTFAQILGRDTKPIVVGEARRKPEDAPCRAVGRTLALSRALRQLSEHYRDLSVALDVVNSLDQP